MSRCFFGDGFGCLDPGNVAAFINIPQFPTGGAGRESGSAPREQQDKGERPRVVPGVF